MDPDDESRDSEIQRIHRENSDSEDRPSNPLGRKAQVGGLIAMLLGFLLFVVLPKSVPGTPLDPHQMAKVFLGFGVFLLVGGTLARWWFLD
jgi:hypothetical protein